MNDADFLRAARNLRGTTQLDASPPRPDEADAYCGRHLVMLDNYDSFTFNLVQMFRIHGLLVTVVRCDRITVNELRGLAPDYVVISPGPKTPASAGISVEAVRELHRHVPMLGVCLGMQCINEAFSGITVRATSPMHGKASRIVHRGQGLFAGIPSPFLAARYHSLVVAPHSAELEVHARSDDGAIMALGHINAPLFGVQFHPESFLTEHGSDLIRNFLQMGARPLLTRPPLDGTAQLDRETTPR